MLAHGHMRTCRASNSTTAGPKQERAPKLRNDGVDIELTVDESPLLQVSEAMQEVIHGPAPPLLTSSRDGGRGGKKAEGSPYMACGPGGANSVNAENLPSAPPPTLSPPARHLAGAGGSIAGAVSLAELAEHMRETTPVSSPVSRCSLQARRREEVSKRQHMLDLSQTLRDGIPLFRSSAEVTVGGKERAGAKHPHDLSTITR